jgi:hypothetical protein
MRRRATLRRSAGSVLGRKAVVLTQRGSEWVPTIFGVVEALETHGNKLAVVLQTGIGRVPAYFHETWLLEGA